MRTNIQTGIKGVIRLVFKQRMQCYGRAITTVTFECNNLKLCQNYRHETPGEVDKFLQICSGTANDLLFIQEGSAPDFSLKCFVCCHTRKLAAKNAKSPVRGFTAAWTSGRKITQPTGQCITVHKNKKAPTFQSRLNVGITYLPG